MEERERQEVVVFVVLRQLVNFLPPKLSGKEGMMAVKTSSEVPER